MSISKFSMINNFKQIVEILCLDQLGTYIEFYRVFYIFSQVIWIVLLTYRINHLKHNFVKMRSWESQIFIFFEVTPVRIPLFSQFISLSNQNAPKDAFDKPS